MNIWTMMVVNFVNRDIFVMVLPEKIARPVDIVLIQQNTVARQANLVSTQEVKLRTKLVTFVLQGSTNLEKDLLVVSFYGLCIIL